MKFLNRLRARINRSESGFTMVELLTVTLLMAIVSVILYEAMGAAIFQTTVTDQQARALQQSRTAVDQLAQDLRAANPIDQLASGEPLSTYDRRISFDIYCSPGTPGCPADKLRKVIYRVTGSPARLEREIEGGAVVTVLGPAGARNRGEILNSSAQPVFRYFDRNGLQLSTAAGSDVAINRCAKAVEIYLVVRAADTGDRSVNMKTRIDLRNEVKGC